ncbi:hypothetical protein BN1058_00769 [Paraliobacillus sp. PM-2]|uniref:DUF6944 family repetitive protein n=1 Tax=Paraliobacillus sp. PM-2 TaxID=1462524 RepID=UPI00061CC84E|nr:hypothetical protein [Paraliobacillus sp. PM-2]CQR46508.1 hypothetical protein BN1058_00769 [Paraliobacillus sp. PM-2]
MSKQENIVFGGWVQAIGTVLSALGNTPNIPIPSKIKEDFDLIGNVLQATGNAIQVETITLEDLNSIGNEIQAIGNTTVVASFLLPVDQTTKEGLDTKGNLLQALGGAVCFSENWKEKNSRDVLYNGIGNLLQVIGNSLQALSSQSKTNATLINTLGSWIQAIGAVMTAIGGTMGDEIFISPNDRSNNYF